jgi:hypothetical protein
MDVWRELIWGKRLTPASMKNMNIFKIYGNDDNVQVKFDYFENFNDIIYSIRILSSMRYIMNSWLMISSMKVNKYQFFLDKIHKKDKI